MRVQSIGFPALALLCLGLERSLAAAGAIGYIIITAVLILPRKQTFVRNLINFIVFQIAMIWVAFLKDKGDRRMFNLREQLKAQYRATQKGRIFTCFSYWGSDPSFVMKQQPKLTKGQRQILNVVSLVTCTLARPSVEMFSAES